jgi:spore germination protein KC
LKKKPAAYGLILLLLLSAANLAGCWGARELNALSLVMGIGIDKKESEPDMIYMTAQIARPDALKKPSSGEGGTQTKAYWNLISSGKTIFDAIREYTHETHNKLYIAHSDIILLGKEAAKDDVLKYLDFFERSQESRPTTQIAVSATTALDAMQIMPELDKIPVVNITELVKAQEFTSQSKEVTMQDFLSGLISKTKCPVAPLVWVIDTDNGEKLVAVKGFAVFKDGRMTGELDENESRGLLWVEGKVKSGVIDLEYQSGQVSIEIKKETTKVKPQISGEQIMFEVEIKEEGVMAAQTSAENLETPQHLIALEALEQEAIRQEVLHTVEKAKQMNADIFGFGEELHKSYLTQWKSLEEQWDQVFPLVQVDVKVECKIRAAGNISRPGKPE